MNRFDVVVIGGGPGGIGAAIMLSRSGKKVALIQEEKDSLGGVCLNRGCMPTKSLLKAAKAFRYARQAEKYGLAVSPGPVNLERLRAVAEQDLETLRGAIGGWMADAGVTVYRGRGSFRSGHELAVNAGDGSMQLLRGESIIVATGSRPVPLPFAPFDGRHILSSDDILRNTELPARLLVAGGGALGCEFATLYSTLGSEVILVEAQETLLPREDAEAGKMLQSAFEGQGISVKTGTVIEKLAVENGKVAVRYRGSDATEFVDKVLVGIGRKPNVEGLNLEAAGVETAQGAIWVNDFMQTSVPHIYAVGDVIGGLMLAHAAEKEAQKVAEHILKGDSVPTGEPAVPRVAFCHPEVAAVGATVAGAGVKTLTLPQVPNGRSVVDKVAPAFVKLFVEEGSSVLTGAVMIGEAATENIHEMALAVENRLTLEQVGKTVHAHPTHAKNVLHAVQHFMMM